MKFGFIANTEVGMVEGLIEIFAPWAKLYGDSKVIPTVVAFGHVSALLWGGGRAVAADLVALRAPSLEGYRSAGGLRFLVESHRDVLTGLVIAAITGVALSTADLKHFLSSPFYFAKLAVVFVLLGNGVFVKRYETSLQTGTGTREGSWRGTRRHAAISLVLWFSAVLLGLALVNE